jgi:glutathione synthase/RimK-type ligase-like ATP-grasp enzyme
MTIHIWYSGATDITGRALAEALEVNGTKQRPQNVNPNDIVIGWGTKIDRDINFAHGNIINHPNAIRKNRNKFKALGLMKADRDLAGNIANFCKADQVRQQIQQGNMVLPLVSRRNYHQGGKGFWLCVCESHVDHAIHEGSEYFQTFIDIADEYRLHVFDGKVIYAVKKVENATEAGWVNQRKEKIADYAQKNNIQLDQATLDCALARLYKEQHLPDRIIRSNKRGWKFSSVAIRNLSVALKNAAIKSVSAIGLDFAAVDCCLDVNNHPWIIEANSGPGLQGTTLEKYIEAFREKIAAIQRPAQARAERPAARRQAPRARRAVGAEVANVDLANVDPADQPQVNVQVNDEALRLLMNEVRDANEARRVLDIAMGRA